MIAKRMNKTYRVPLLFDGAGGGSLLPPELQACEYITNSNTSAYIKTNIIFDKPLITKFKANNLTVNKFYFGNQNSNITDSIGIRSITGNNFQIFAGNNIIRTVNNDNNIHTIIISNNIIQYDDVIFNISGNYTNEEIYLFTGNGNTFINTNIYSCNDLIPCYVKPGETFVDNKANACPAGTPGMFDTVNNIFYTNDGPGNFSAGPDINI